MRNGHSQTVGGQVASIRVKLVRSLGLLLMILVIPQLLLLNGCAGVVASSGKQTGLLAAFQLNPASINFGQVAVGKQVTQSVSVANTGNTALNITQLQLSNPQFSLPGVSTPMALAVGQSTNITVAVDPTSAGTVTGTLTAQGDSGSAPVVVSLSATAVSSQPQLSAAPASLNFGSVATGSPASQSIVLTNTGNAAASISSVSAQGTGFSVSGVTTPATLNPSQSLTLSVQFAPSAAGSATGSVTVLSDAVNSTLAIPLSGTGVQPGLTITPASANFGSVTVGSPSTQTFQMSNSGTSTLSISQVSATGSGFSVGTLSLPISLTAGQATSFNVQFSPVSAGAVTGSVTIVSNAPNSPAAIALNGTGVAATQILSFNPTTVGFGNVNTGSSSTQSVTVTNTGNANVSISQIAAGGTGFTLSGASTPVTLTPNQILTFSVIFSPSSTGSFTGTVTVTSNATGSPATITLSGTGVQATTSHTVTLNWTASTSTVSGYNVYRSTTSGTGYVKINGALVAALTYSDSTVQSATTYYYVTTAVDSSGNESADSNQATAVIP